MKINGLKNPLGFALERVLCSFKVTDTKAVRPVKTLIQVSKDPSFHSVDTEVSYDGMHFNEIELPVKLTPCTRYYWRVYVTGDNGEHAVSESAYFETDKMAEPWKAKWIGTAPEDTFHPVFVRSFLCENTVKRARLYICGLGLYEAYINGKKTGEELLAPFINDYREAFQYETYDVTGLLQKNNTICVYLGKGWYMGTFGLGLRKNNFGDRMQVIAELHMEYEDGKKEIISTDESWGYRGSDIEESGIYFGEIFNRMLWNEKENPLRPALPTEVPGRLTGRYSPCVIRKEKIVPVRIIRTPVGETVVDMGQNFGGIMEFYADFAVGTKIHIQCGEILQNGCFYHDNYRDAEAVFVYVSDGRKELVRPHFTSYGYRYLKVSGWPGELQKENITGWAVYSDLDRTGYIETSNRKISRLYENCLWSQRSNFLDMPTDCPQRSERLGWTGDAQVFASTACYNMDTRAFFRKFLKDLRYEQKRMNGGIPNYIPNLDHSKEACSVWGDAAVFIPATLYEKYGNSKEMEQYYPLMKDWVEYMTAQDEAHGHHYMFRPPSQFGDWLAQDGITPQSFKGGTDDDYIGAVYYYRSTVLLAEMAGCLGKEKDAEYYSLLADKIRNAVLHEYFSPAGRLTVDTQAAYVIALKFGLYVDRDILIRQFKNRLKRDCYEIRCGFVGAPLLCTTLCENGMEDLAYHFLFKEEFPSWLYCVNLGATTIWERWNSMLEDGTCSGTGMNSFNHYAYGTIVEFLYAYVGGIRVGEKGFAEPLIAPVPDIRMGDFKCSYDSAYGKYVCNWEIRENGRFAIHVEIPFGCRAKVILPDYQECDVQTGVTSANDGSIQRSESFPEIPASGEMLLESGNYDISYIPARDYRRIYNRDTRLEEVAGDAEVLAILKDELPVIYGMVMGDDKENRNFSFRELESMPFLGIDPKQLRRTAEKIYRCVRCQKDKERGMNG